MSDDMKTWLINFEKALKKSFYEDEVKEILDFYIEMIEERRQQGESIETILGEYDIPKIIKEMTPEVLMKRSNDSYLKLSKSTKQLLILLISSPVLLPLGVVYVSMLIFLGSMMIVSGVLLVGALGTYVGLIMDLIMHPQVLPNTLGLLGFGLMMTALLVMASIWIYQLMMFLIKKTVTFVSKLAKNRG